MSGLASDRSAAPARSAGAARTWLALGLLVAVTLVSLAWRVHPYYHATGDGSLYLLTARSLIEGQGYSYLGSPFIVRPPGFSVLIAPVLAAFGTNFLALNLYISLFGILCLSLLQLYLTPRLGPWLGLAVTLSIWINPMFQRLCQQVMSDIPGAALMIACLLVERRVGREPGPRGDVLLGALVAGAAYVRSINLLLVPAIVVSRYLRAWRAGPPERSPARFLRRRAAVVIGVPMLALIPWSVRNAVVEPESPAEQQLLFSYSVAMWHEDKGDPDSPRITWRAFLERVPRRMGDVAGVLGSRLGSVGLTEGRLVVALAGLACWLAVLLRRQEAGEVFVAGALVLLSVYFGFVDRLVLPIYLLVFPAVVEVACSLLRRLVAARGAAVIVAASVLQLAVLDFEPVDVEEVRARNRLKTDVCKVLAERFAPDASFAAYNGRHWGVYLERDFYTLKHAASRDGMQRVQEIVDSNGVAAVVLSHIGRQRGLLEYFASRYPLERRVGYYKIFRIAPLEP